MGHHSACDLYQRTRVSSTATATADPFHRRSKDAGSKTPHVFEYIYKTSSFLTRTENAPYCIGWAAPAAPAPPALSIDSLGDFGTLDHIFGCQKSIRLLASGHGKQSGRTNLPPPDTNRIHPSPPSVRSIRCRDVQGNVCKPKWGSPRSRDRKAYT